MSRPRDAQGNACVASSPPSAPPPAHGSERVATKVAHLKAADPGRPSISRQHAQAAKYDGPTATATVVLRGGVSSGAVAGSRRGAQAHATVAASAAAAAPAAGVAAPAFAAASAADCVSATGEAAVPAALTPPTTAGTTTHNIRSTASSFGVIAAACSAFRRSKDANGRVVLLPLAADAGGPPRLPSREREQCAAANARAAAATAHPERSSECSKLGAEPTPGHAKADVGLARPTLTLTPAQKRDRAADNSGTEAAVRAMAAATMTAASADMHRLRYPFSHVLFGDSESISRSAAPRSNRKRKRPVTTPLPEDDCPTLAITCAPDSRRRQAVAAKRRRASAQQRSQQHQPRRLAAASACGSRSSDHCPAVVEGDLAAVRCGSDSDSADDLPLILASKHPFQPRRRPQPPAKPATADAAAIEMRRSEDECLRSRRRPSVVARSALAAIAEAAAASSKYVARCSRCGEAFRNNQSLGWHTRRNACKQIGGRKPVLAAAATAGRPRRRVAANEGRPTPAPPAAAQLAPYNADDAARVRALMARLGVPQAEVARATVANHRALSNWLCGRATHTPSTLKASTAAMAWHAANKSNGH